MTRLLAYDRGISPVVGLVLLVAIAIALVSVSAYMIFGISEEREPAPEVALAVEQADDGIAQVLAHEHGDRLVGEKVALRGAADPDVLDGTNLTSGRKVTFYAVQEEIRVVYTGEFGTTYTLDTFEVKTTVPEPDEGCDWVDSETNGGTDDAKITGTVVNCDVTTDKVIEVQNEGAVIGDTDSNTKTVDADDARFYGSVTADEVVNIQDSVATGSVTSRTADVKLTNGTVEGSVDAQKVAELQSGSSVDGDVISSTKQAKVLDSEVSGSVVSDDTVKLDGATVEGDVYVDDSDFDCTSSTIDGQSCSEYNPEDPGEY